MNAQLTMSCEVPSKLSHVKFVRCCALWRGPGWTELGGQSPPHPRLQRSEIFRDYEAQLGPHPSFTHDTLGLRGSTGAELGLEAAGIEPLRLICYHDPPPKLSLSLPMQGKFSGMKACRQKELGVLWFIQMPLKAAGQPLTASASWGEQAGRAELCAPEARAEPMGTVLEKATACDGDLGGRMSSVRWAMGGWERSLLENKHSNLGKQLALTHCILVIISAAHRIKSCQVRIISWNPLTHPCRYHDLTLSPPFSFLPS